MSHDALSIRMKEFYENRAKQFLPRRTYTIIRIDGKSFHTYTKGLQRPFDIQLISDMNDTCKYLCENIQGCQFGYVQSDEISLLLTDFNKLTTSAWFDGNVQKITSISASLATAKFNELRPGKLAHFDSRVFTIPNKIEVENYFIWRQQDATKNSISALAQSLYSHKELHEKNASDMQELCFQKGQNWNDLSVGVKRGRLIEKLQSNKNGSIRTRWVCCSPPIFTQNKEYLNNLIPIPYQDEEKE
jgi:tRNA(His) 5'-end guanylyltransferase